MFPRFWRIVFLAGVTGLLVLTARPDHDGLLRWGLPVSLLAVWLGCLMLFRRTQWLVMALPVLAIVPFLLPARAPGGDGLRQAYLDGMRGMEGVRYVWGGESSRGIDCSGLPRLALRKALLAQGWGHLDGAAFREWTRQWWYDTSAKAMGQGHRGFTRATGVSGTPRSIAEENLQPGDLAVTATQTHVMVYLGPGEWIQADPRPGRVTIGRPATDAIGWFDSQVTIHRWRVLE